MIDFCINCICIIKIRLSIFLLMIIKIKEIYLKTHKAIAKDFRIYDYNRLRVFSSGILG